MRGVWLPRNRANILRIRLGVQDQQVGRGARGCLGISPPGIHARLYLTQVQHHWLVIGGSDFHDQFCPRPWQGGELAKLTQVQDAVIGAGGDPEGPTSNQVHVAIASQVVKPLHLRRGPQDTLPWRCR